MHLPGLLSLLIFLPILAGIIIFFISDHTDPVMERSTALVASLANALLSLMLLSGGKAVDGVMNLSVAPYEEHFKWIQALGITYHLRSDGLSVFLIVLVTFLTPAAIAASWHLISGAKAHVYYGCMLLLSGGMVGVLAAHDLFLFYVFWEVMLIPAFFLVGVFGGDKRVQATTKFVIYTMVGSLLMLVGVVYAGWRYYALHHAWSFDLDDLVGLTMDPTAASVAFLAFVLAFGIKAALFPLHTWLPDTYAEAPAPVTFMLSALMAKMGVYGFLRVALPLFPDAAHSWSPVLVGLAATGVVYAAFVALVQKDAKRVLAYSSVSHLGVILLGVFTLSPQALSGAVLQMVAHALSTGALFLLVGFLYERRGTTLIDDWGGAAKAVPVFATVFMIVMLASVGLPGLSGFVGEFLIFLGAYRDHATAAVVAASSIIFGAAYMLWLYQRLMFGPENPDTLAPRLPDLTWREGMVFIPMVALIITVGLAPQILLSRINPATDAYLSKVVLPTGNHQ
ncbi:MAG: nuoM [Cyanobacteria bacterium RYN_339]|nr:nuoM [Cyanobacteria bacterium RYN_339]